MKLSLYKVKTDVILLTVLLNVIGILQKKRVVKNMKMEQQSYLLVEQEKKHLIFVQ